MARRFSSRRWSSPAARPSSHTARRSVAAPHQELRHKGHRHQANSKQSAKDGESPEEAGRSPKSSSALIFGCLLIPQFPVWAAHYVDPILAATPLLIAHRGHVVAACRESQSAGIRSGWTIQRAQSLFPAAHVRAYNSGEITYAWNEVLAALYHLTPRIEPVRPGLLFFEPPAYNSTEWLSTMAALAKLVRNIDAQAALAPDRATAELAAHQVAPGMVRRIQRAEILLARTPITKLSDLGLSDHYIERFGWLGFATVADLRILSREQIACQFASSSHRNDLTLLWRLAQAGTADADCQRIQTFPLPPSLHTRFVFEQAATQPAQWEPALNDATGQVVAQLGGMSAGAVSVTLDTKTEKRTASKLLREPTSSDRTLFRVARDLVLSLSPQNDESVEVHSLEVRLSRLQTLGSQSTLFDPGRYSSNINRELPRALVRAFRSVEARYTGTMGRWRLRDEHAPLREDRYSFLPLDECAPSTGLP